MCTGTRGSPSTPGRTIITVPFVLEELAAVAGRSISEYVTIVPCDPFYRIYFADGPRVQLRRRPGPARGRDRPVQPRRRAGYRAYLAYTEKVFDRAFTDLADHSFHSLWEMVKVAPDLIRLRAEQSVYRRVSTFIQDPRAPPGLLVRNRS